MNNAFHLCLLILALLSLIVSTSVYTRIGYFCFLTKPVLVCVEPEPLFILTYQ